MIFLWSIAFLVLWIAAIATAVALICAVCFLFNDKNARVYQPVPAPAPAEPHASTRRRSFSRWLRRLAHA